LLILLLLAGNVLAPDWLAGGRYRPWRSLFA